MRVIKLFDELRTCADVRALRAWGISEGLRMDYKEGLKPAKGGRKEFAKNVCALANAEGGLLVVEVRDPKPESEPPNLEDFVEVAATETLAWDVDSILLGPIAPPLHPLVRLTKDDFLDVQTGERRRCI